MNNHQVYKYYVMFFSGCVLDRTDTPLSTHYFETLEAAQRFAYETRYRAVWKQCLLYRKRGITTFSRPVAPPAMHYMGFLVPLKERGKYNIDGGLYVENLYNEFGKVVVMLSESRICIPGPMDGINMTAVPV